MSTSNKPEITVEEFRRILSEPVAQHLKLWLYGKNRTYGFPVHRPISMLVEKANEANETDVESWTVKRLLDWHCDYVWRINETGNV